MIAPDFGNERTGTAARTGSPKVDSMPAWSGSRVGEVLREKRQRAVEQEAEQQCQRDRQLDARGDGSRRYRALSTTIIWSRSVPVSATNPRSASRRRICHRARIPRRLAAGRDLPAVRCCRPVRRDAEVALGDGPAEGSATRRLIEPVSTIVAYVWASRAPASSEPKASFAVAIFCCTRTSDVAS